MMRTCTRCRTEKHAGAFAKHAWCRECQRAYNVARAKNPASHQRDAVKSAEWRRAHPDYQREWASKNAERVRSAQQRYRANNADAARESNRRWREKNPEKVKAAPAMAPERRRDVERRYVESHRPQVREKIRRRRARILGATICAFTPEQLEQRLSMFGGNCWMCGRAGTAVDHVKPLAKGGAHALANMRPACKSCNSRKSDNWPAMAA